MTPPPDAHPGQTAARRPVLSARQLEPTDHVDDGHEPTLTDLDRDTVLAGRASVPAQRRRRRRWGRVLLAGLLVLLLVIGAGAVLAEGRARDTVDQRIATAISSAFDTQAHAQLNDRVVLWSLARGRLGSVDFDAPQATIRTGDNTIRLVGLRGTLTDITHPADPDNTRIGRLRASAVMEWDELSALSGADIRPTGDGRVQLDRTISVLGADIGVQITARPTLDPATGRIVLEDPAARAARIPIPGALLARALDQVNEKLELPDLPALQYESLETSSNGMRLQVGGSDVLLRELS